ncbi:biotin/lipoyl-binding protein [Granulicella sp. 5B5]|uniref:HlyD family secretion protein n=1 Tax=Granulicella sp. 5B5 TaxID=1617967 RepID=UPI0015F63474|nr:efflux RND transporter periplasmic adaptor subunit [Granulicella sp. 5B5]QMV17548.1 biotin/lipoyl-binding protein [Granulicella sp. 5B5]
MNGKKILFLVLGLVAIVGLVVGTWLHSRSNVLAVTTAKAVREDLDANVSGTGQIRPKTFVNVGATAFGRITHLYVKEGDHVKAGDILAKVESVQPEATVSAQKAAIQASETDINSYIAAEKTAVANVSEAKADLQQKQLDYTRAKELYQDQLIAKQDYDAKVAAYNMSEATLQQRNAAVAQALAQTASARGHMDQAVASQRANYDSLDKTVSRAPFDGLVTNVPVREGETVVVGIQNAEGSTLMTLADMSVITAEVKVDETDIVNVALGQPADVTVDALPGRVFKGHVTEVGDQALLRTTGQATSTSTTGTEEAKDFKVVVTLDGIRDNGTQIPDQLRPGLSCTAKITTAHKPDTLTIPIQALVERDAAKEAELFKNNGKVSPTAAPTDPGKAVPLVQGVYLLVDEKNRLRVKFVPVTTGVTGTTDIQVLSGLKPGDELVTGRYKTLRILKSGLAVKRDNSIAAPIVDDSTS